METIRRVPLESDGEQFLLRRAIAGGEEMDAFLERLGAGPGRSWSSRGG